jgi:hypothetical protein
MASTFDELTRLAQPHETIWRHGFAFGKPVLWIVTGVATTSTGVALLCAFAVRPPAWASTTSRTLTRHFRRHVGSTPASTRPRSAAAAAVERPGSRFPGHLDHMPVGIEALEPDVGLGVLVLDELDAFGNHPRSEVSGLLR